MNEHRERLQGREGWKSTTPGQLGITYPPLSDAAKRRRRARLRRLHLAGGR